MAAASDLAVDVLAVARLTRLATNDRLTKDLRRSLIRAVYRHANRPVPDHWEQFGPTVVIDDPDAPLVAYLASCGWCASFWIGFGAVAARAIAPGLWSPLARALAASELAGLANSVPSH